MRGVFLDKATIEPSGIDFSALESALPDWQFYDQSSNLEEINNRIKAADIVVSNKAPLSVETLKKALPSLKCICIAATGADHVDVAAAKRLGIHVCNVVNYSTPSVVQHTFGLMIALMSQIVNYYQLVSKGAWAAARRFCLTDYQTRELAGKKLGIIGYGNIGRQVHQVASAFGMEVLVSDRKHVSSERLRADRRPFDEVIAQADVISLHCPLRDETRDLISDAEFLRMKPNAILINVARGGIVNEGALYRALINDRIGGAGLDVLLQEPPSTSNLLLRYDGLRLIVTPHVAWNAVEARQRLVNELALNIKAFRQGILRNTVL